MYPHNEYEAQRQYRTNFDKMTLDTKSVFQYFITNVRSNEKYVIANNKRKKGS